ncbi:MAG: acetate--CoA ligase family protein [Coriobacteriia bacterium]
MLEGFFSPRSVAVVGVSRDEEKVGHAIFDNVLRGGFAGAVYPVNPRADEIHGHRCYPSLAALPVTPDLAVIVVPASAVNAVLEECGAVGTTSAIIISAGFKEIGPAGAVLEREVLRTARKLGMRILGPNCLGLISTAASLNASFAPSTPVPGTVAFMSQSGALGTAVLDWAAGEGIGLSHFVSLGNKADVSEVDLVRAWESDPNVAVVVSYLEAVGDGTAFVDAVSALVRTKPFIALKAGGSDAGARAVSSHTGSLAGSEKAYEAAFYKAGVIRARSVQELFDLAAAFSRQPLSQGPGLCILTNAGGPAILATDACEALGVPLASLEAETIRALGEVLPPAAALYNPVDVLGDALPDRYAAAAKSIVADPNVHSLLVILTPQAMTDAAGTAHAIADAVAGTGVTVAASFMGARAVAEGVHVLRNANIPQYEFPERAVTALAAMERYRDALATPLVVESPVEADRAVVRHAIDHAQAAGRTFITEESASRVAAAYGISVPAGGVSKDLAMAREMAGQVGYPVVLKIASPDILHKSDIGGIAVRIEDEIQLAAAYEDIMTRVHTRMPDARVWGLTVQHQIDDGREVIIGVNRDPQFGPLLMFGLGGIYVEILKDVTFRLCPVSRAEAHRMITEIRGFGLLRGARGQRPADLDAVADTIVHVSALAMDFPEITELDINPLIVADKGAGAIAADVRIGIGG